MRLLLIAGLIVGIAWLLLRNTQDRRRAWLERLALAGSWQGQQDGIRYRLQLDGGPAAGRYLEVEEGPDGRVEEHGEWRVAGHDIEFRPDEGNTTRCELRLFETGRIGIHGPGRERRIYVRDADNVVRLPRRGGDG